MPHIFVSYTSTDRDAAFRTVDFLEGQGIHCRVAPRNVARGVEYGIAIINLIEQCKVSGLMLSDQSNDSQFPHFAIHQQAQCKHATSFD